MTYSPEQVAPEPARARLDSRKSPLDFMFRQSPQTRQRHRRLPFRALLCLVSAWLTGTLAAQQGPAAEPTRAPGTTATAGADGAMVTKDQFIQQLSNPAPLPAGIKLRGMSVHKAPAVSVQIFFKTGSAEVADETSLKQLREAGEALKSETLSSYRFQIEGHTDNVGGHDYNAQLSRRRAEAITGYLRSRYGIAAERLEPIGKAETEPVADNTTEEGRAQNRRVVFKRAE